MDGMPFATARASNMSARPGLRSSTSFEAMLNTIEHERHAKGALLHAFASDLGESMSESAPESTRTLLARAKDGSLTEEEIPVLLDELRASVAA